MLIFHEKQIQSSITSLCWALRTDVIIYPYLSIAGFPGGTVVRNLPTNAGDSRDAGSIPGLERSPGIRNGNLLQYSCLENPMDRVTWNPLQPPWGCRVGQHWATEITCAHTHTHTHTPFHSYTLLTFSLVHANCIYLEKTFIYNKTLRY